MLLTSTVRAGLRSDQLSLATNAPGQNGPAVTDGDGRGRPGLAQLLSDLVAKGEQAQCGSVEQISGRVCELVEGARDGARGRLVLISG